MRLNNALVITIKVVVHAANLLAVVWLCFSVINGHLGSDPVQAVTHFTGKGILHLLFLTLLITPLARLFKLSFLFKFRRLLGLYSFFWACLHLLTFMWLELAWELNLITEEIISRPYLVLGMTAWLILFCLAVTSTKKLQSKMGKSWQKLHNWVYTAMLLGVIHYYWSVKSGVIEPGVYITVAILLLMARKDKFLHWLKLN